MENGLKRVKERADSAKQERDAKVKALQDQAATAKQDMKAKYQERIAHIRAAYDERVKQLTRREVSEAPGELIDEDGMESRDIHITHDDLTRLKNFSKLGSVSRKQDRASLESLQGELDGAPPAEPTARLLTCSRSHASA